MKINNEKLLEIEKAFGSLKINESDMNAISTISNRLKELTGKSFNISITKPVHTRDACSVMTVYPDERTIDSIISSIVNLKNDGDIFSLWKKCNFWNIEIDSRVLYSTMNFTEKELTALLMHEVGHTVYSNSVPVRLATVVKLGYVKSDLVTKSLLKDGFLSRLLCFPVIHACNSDKNRSSMRAELAADRYVVSAGYGEALKSAIDKVIIYAGTDTTIDDDIEELMGFTVDTILSLQKRQTVVARNKLGALIANLSSPFEKKYISKISNAFKGNTTGGSITERVFEKRLYENMDKIMESVNDHSNLLLTEGVFSRVHKLKKIDPVDIDYIGLQIDDIKSNDDKIMIVSYIYNKIDIIDYYISLIDSKSPKYIVPHSKESLLAMRDTLNKYRLAAINKRLIAPEYGINIQYPAGYEG